MHEEACAFRVWAPKAREIILQLDAVNVPMRREGEYFVAETPARPGDLYSYRVDGGPPLPDPVSRALPEGVHGRTEIIDPDAFAWSDSSWRGVGWKDYILYELHVGTFSALGSFAGVIEKLDYLQELGVTAIELMPVAAFPGERNWGYDGVSLYAVQSSYGGPEGLRRLVDAAHARGLAVVLDVVYNHAGNEGNYLRAFGPYFTDRYQTPWGAAIDYARAGVREHVVANALYWLREYHLDGLRLDAVHAIHDERTPPILAEITAAAHAYAREAGRSIAIMAESDQNDARLVNAWSFDGFWSDDFHHAVHALFTGERAGYYQDFGGLGQIATALAEGYVFQGQPFSFWGGKTRGTPAQDVPLEANIICLQNHDQIGNRAQGERIGQLIKGAAARKAAAALLLLAPHTPLLFMGQEWDETAPFQFFTSFTDPALREAVRAGRRREFKDFDFRAVPDPEDPQTFRRSRLHWERASADNEMLMWYQALIGLRKRWVINGERRTRIATPGPSILEMRSGSLLVTVNLQGSELPPVRGERLMHAADEHAAVAVERV